MPRCSILALCFTFFLVPLVARADWYDGAWEYRRDIQVSNPGSVGLSNYAVAINLATPGFDFAHAASDGADLRFTDADGVTPLGFWIQDLSSFPGQAKVWVKIPFLPPNSTHTIFVYSGNPAAAPASDGASTFPAFAGFEQNFDVTARVATQNLGKMAYAPETTGPLIPLGAVGEFDHWGMREHGNVLYEPDDPDPARRYKTWYSAIGDSAYTSDRMSWLGQAISPDGYNWTKLGRVSTTIHGEDPYVVRVGDTYYLYYEGKTASFYDDVSLMTSPDGINWSYYDRVILPNPNFNWMDRSPSSPTVWVETSGADTTWYCFFEGKGTGPNRGGGSLGLATSTDGHNFTVYGSDPIIPLGNSGQWDSAAMVPDCIYREDGLYWLIYHGHNGITGFKAGYAYSTDLIHWTKAPAISGNNGITPVGDPQVFWDADGKLTATMCTNGIYRGYLFGRDSSQWPYNPDWNLETRGGAFGLTSAVAGSLRVSAESFLRSSSNLISTQRWTDGFEIELRERAYNYGSQVLTSLAIGSGDVVDMNTGGQGQWETTSLQSGYLVWVSNNAVMGRMPANGGKAVLASFAPDFGLIGSYNVHRLVYDRSNFLKWYAGDTLRLSVRDTTWANNPKRVLISQGELVNGAGGIQDIDWIFVRSIATPEPASALGEEETACAGQVVYPNGGESLILGDSLTVQWTGADPSRSIRVELNRAYPSGNWETLADNTADDGSESFLLGGSSSTTCRIRIACLPSGSSDVSNSDFSIVAALLPACGTQVIAPNGGEVLTLGLPTEIQWSANDPGGFMRLELNRHYPQAAWEMLADSVINDGSETVTILGLPSTNCRLRVTCLSYGQSDVSVGDFMLVSPQQILIVPSDGRTVNGCQADFDLYVMATMSDMQSFQIGYEYDPTAVQFLGAEVVPDGGLASVQSASVNDTIELSGIFTVNFSGLDTLVRLSFHVLAESDTTVQFTYAGGTGTIGTGDSTFGVPLAGTYSTLTIDATPPVNPANITLRPIGGPDGNNGLRLDWTPVTHDVEGDTVIAPVYTIYFTDFSDMQEYFVGSTFSTNFTDTYTHGTNYGAFDSGQYIVRACKSQP